MFYRPYDSLSVDDQRFLALSYLLTQYVTLSKDAFWMECEEEKDDRSISVPVKKKNGTEYKELHQLFGVEKGAMLVTRMRKQLATDSASRVMAFAQDVFPAHEMPSIVLVKNDGHALACVPTYDGVFTLLAKAAKNEWPILVNIKRLEVSADKQSHSCQGADCLVYVFDAEANAFVQQGEDFDRATPSATFEFCSIYDPATATRAVDPFSSCSDWTSFMEVWKSFQIDNLVLTAASVADSEIGGNGASDLARDWKLKHDKLFMRSVRKECCGYGGLDIGYESNVTYTTYSRVTENVPLFLCHVKVSSYNLEMNFMPQEGACAPAFVKQVSYCMNAGQIL